MMARSVLVWLAILPLAVVNGLVRDKVLVHALGPFAAMLASGIALSLLVMLLARACVGWMQVPSQAAAWRIGALWLVLTLAFESGFGLLLGLSPAQLLRAYTFEGGNLWSLVLAATFAAPAVAWRAARRPARA
jgi:hypothetical protein